MRFRGQNLTRGVARTILILLFASSSVGQTQPAPADAPKTGAITGKVVNESGQALPNATVWARAFGSTERGDVVITDRDGTFTLTGLQRVPYSIVATMPAYTPVRDPENSQPRQYRVGDSITFVLIKGGVITGKVATSEGAPVVAIGVRVDMIRDANGRRVTSGREVREVPTDDRGIYRIYGLPTGTYIVMASGTNDHSRIGMNVYESDVPTYASSATRETAAEISVRAGEETTDVDIRYRGEQGNSINGIVSGPLRDRNGFTVTLTSIGEGGSQVNDNATYHEPGSREFVFNGIAEGDYYLTAQSHLEKGEMAVSDSKLIKIRGEDVTGIELIMQPLASISGRVVLEETKAVECTDKERPVLTETSVAAWHKEQEAARDRARFVWSIGVPANADAQGNVTLRNLAAGEYRFVTRFSGKYWYLQSISFVRPGTKAPSAKPIDAMKTWTTVKSGDRLSGLTVTLAQGAASLTGQLLLGEGETVSEKLFVYLVPVEREKADDVLRFYAAAVSADGKIALDNLAPGRYWILAQPPIDGAESPLTKLRLPDETETRLRLRRAAESAKTEIELKPCQNVGDFRLPK